MLEVKNNEYECISAYEKKFLISDKYRVGRANGKIAWFHRWTEISQVAAPSPMVGGHPGGQLSEPFAIVEYGDGKIDMVNPCEIEFLDNPNRKAMREV